MIGTLRNRLLIGVWIVGLLVASGWVGASQTGGAGSVTIPLPAVQQAEIQIVTVTVTSDGKRANHLTARTTNDSQLGNLSVIYAVPTPKKTKGKQTLEVFALIKRWTVRAEAGARDTPSVDLTIKADYGSVPAHLTTESQELDCAEAKTLDTAFEPGHEGDVGRLIYSLENGRSKTAQPSPEEAVLDEIIDTYALKCVDVFTPETPEDGDQ